MRAGINVLKLENIHGAGVHSTQMGISLSVSLSSYSFVFQPEITAIIRCFDCEPVRNLKRSTLLICSNCNIRPSRAEIKFGYYLYTLWRKKSIRLSCLDSWTLGDWKKRRCWWAVNKWFASSYDWAWTGGRVFHRWNYRENKRSRVDQKQTPSTGEFLGHVGKQKTLLEVLGTKMLSIFLNWIVKTLAVVSSVHRSLKWAPKKEYHSSMFVHIAVRR